MSTLPQVDQKETKAVRIREEVWEAARAEAFHSRKSIVDVLDLALRAHFKLPGAADEDAA